MTRSKPSRAWPIVACLLLACGSGGGETGLADPAACAAETGLSADQKRRAEALTSLFENGTPELQYGYAEALGDGRGITAGRAGFTTATGDAYEVVRRYVETAPAPDSALAAYLPALARLAEEESDDTADLEGFEDAWAEAAMDARFRAVQDAVVDEMYYRPALALAADAGLCRPLSVAIFYDTIIQHGEGDDPDGLPALISRTPAQPDEEEWITSFLAVRRADLAHAADPATREVWAESVGRCDALQQLIDDGAWTLDPPLDVHSGGFEATID